MVLVGGASNDPGSVQSETAEIRLRAATPAPSYGWRRTSPESRWTAVGSITNWVADVTIQDLGSIGEFVAAIATVATLVYLAIQIRSNTAAPD